MFPVFTATGLFLFFCACIPINFALVVRFNGHTDFGAGLSIFNGSHALHSARMRAYGKKKHWPWKNAGASLEKRGMILAVLHSGRHLMRHARLTLLHISGTLALSDAAATALLCGGVQAFSGAVAPFLSPNCLRVSLRPDFTSAAGDAAFCGMICVSAGHIMLAALKGAWHYLKTTRRTPAHGKASD